MVVIGCIAVASCVNNRSKCSTWSSPSDDTIVSAAGVFGLSNSWDRLPYLTSISAKKDWIAVARVPRDEI